MNVTTLGIRNVKTCVVYLRVTIAANPPPLWRVSRSQVYSV